MREGIKPPQFADQFFRIDFDAAPMPVLTLYPIPAPLKEEEILLDVSGLGGPPRLIPWPTLKNLPRVKMTAPLICQIFNWVETVEWEGIRLVDLLDYLKIDTHPEGYFAFYSRDRAFFEGLSRDEARDPRVLLATSLNGSPLPEAHGGPLRLVVPFLQGYKSVKWVGAIRAFRNDPIGIKRLLGQSPTGQLNEKWKHDYQIVPPDGKMGDPPLLAPTIEREEKPASPLAPVIGEITPVAPSRGREPSVWKTPKGKSGLLKEIIAIVRPAKRLATRQALEAAGIFSYTATAVLGRSRQRGLRFTPQSGESASEGKEGVAIKFLPKQCFSIVVEESRLSAAVGAIIKANKTGKGTFGDGKIFVVDIDDAVRISDGEKGASAV